MRLLWSRQQWRVGRRRSWVNCCARGSASSHGSCQSWRLALASPTAALAIWWLTSLNGLPDIGDPFDVAAIRAFTIPEHDNAFTFFRRANDKLSPCPLSPGEERSAAIVAWSEADPKLRAWVEANRPALELFQRGAERPDGISRRPGEPYSGRHSEDLGPHHLTLLALVEGGRRAEGGDMAGAWDCYRAVLRATVFSARRGVFVERHFAGVHHGWLRKRLEAWAADPRTTIPQLQRALEEAVESRPRPEWYAFSLKLEYLYWMSDLETTRHPDLNALEEEWTYRLGDMELPLALTRAHYHARRFLMREPERSRRATRLLFANWLAEVEGSELRRRKPAARAVFRHAKHSDSLWLYPVDPAASAGHPSTVAARTGRLARHGRRPQADRVESVQAGHPLQGSGRISRAGRCAGRGTLSPRTRDGSAFRGRPCRDLSQELAR